MNSKLSNININAVKLFGIDVSFLNYDEYLHLLKEGLNERKQIIINYCNANTVRLVNKNQKLLSIFSNSSIIHADGIGIYLAAKLLCKQKIRRFNWTDYANLFLEECSANGWSIFFLGSDEKTLEKMKYNLKVKYPNLNVTGSLNGYDDVNKNAVEIINQSSPDILWVGMGTPKQEQWIIDNYKNLNSIIIQSVGGLFDFLAGSRLRGPEIIRKIGFEWLFRVLQHPTKYFDRYILGIPVFFYLLTKEKFKNLLR